MHGQMSVLSRIMFIVPAVLCCSCGSAPGRPEWKDQPLIFQAHPKMSSGFVSVEEDDQTLTLTADLGTSPSGSPEPMKQIDIQRLPSVCIVTEGRQDIRIGPVEIKRDGTHLYAAFSARAQKPGRISLSVYENDKLAEGLLKVLDPGSEWKRYRFIVRIHRPAVNITLRVQTDATVEIEEFGSLCKMPI